MTEVAEAVAAEERQTTGTLQEQAAAHKAEVAALREEHAGALASVRQDAAEADEAAAAEEARWVAQAAEAMGTAEAAVAHEAEVTALHEEHARLLASAQQTLTQAEATVTETAADAAVQLEEVAATAEAAAAAHEAEVTALQEDQRGCKLDAIQLTSTCMPYGSCLGPYKMSLRLFVHALEAEFE
jgi:hypothetical protein